jgi:hypothetical protein
MRRHRHSTAIALALALSLLIGGCVAWRFAHAPLGFLIVPGATEVEVQSIGLSEQQITYSWDGAPYGWYFAIIRSLSAGGWSAPVDNRAGLSRHPETHWRISRLGFVYLAEEIALQGDRDFARIRVRRRLIIPWRQYLP